jgi:hypothetical protein
MHASEGVGARATSKGETPRTAAASVVLLRRGWARVGAGAASLMRSASMASSSVLRTRVLSRHAENTLPR